MGEFSLTHWLVIAVVGILLFGPKRLPGLGQSLGESIRGFKKALNDETAPPEQQQQQARRENLAPASPTQPPLNQPIDVEHVSTTTTTVKDTTHS